MMNPLAQTFMIATRNEQGGLWTHVRTDGRGRAPRLLPAPKDQPRRRFRLFRRNGDDDAAAH